MRKSFWAIYLLLSSAGITQQPAKPPVITEAQKIAYFKAQSEFFSSQIQAQQASQIVQQKQKILQDIVKEITDVCGKSYDTTTDAKGEPTCAVKPEEPKGKK